MVRKLLSVGLLSLLSASLGCAMCCSTDDPNYAVYGGRWQRHDMSFGRVGSAFNDAGFDSLNQAEEAGGTVDEELPGNDGLTDYDTVE